MDAEATVETAGLVYVTDAAPGLRRARRGDGLVVLDPDGRPIRDAATLERVQKLGIPPAWEDVWIAPDPDGHLQATGRDGQGRKQYRYHARWCETRSTAKYGRMAPFGEALPALRARVDQDLRQEGLPREKVLALAVALLDETFIRIGNDEYAAQNRSFGLTTLRDRHADFSGPGVRLAFVGKSGVEHDLKVADRRLARIVKACRDLPGQRLFQFYDEAGSRQPLDSGMVNQYLRETTGEDFTAKCFRTWGGTVLAAKALGARPAPADEQEAKAAVVETIKDVAHRLGNTVAVCRGHYVHPDVLAAYAEGSLQARLRRRHAANTPAGLEPAEAAVLDVLKERGTGPPTRARVRWTAP